MPSNQIFYLIFFFLKFIVAYMATNNIKRKEDNIFTLYDILKAITIFGNNFCIFKNFYSILCLGFFILILFFYLLMIFAFREYIKKGTCSSIIVGLSYVLMCFSFFSHYISELLTPGILVYSFTVDKALNENHIDEPKCKNEFLTNIITDKHFPRYVLCPMNIITFLAMNMILYLFLIFMNAPTRSFKHGNLNFNYKKVSLSTYMTYVLQGFITVTKLYSKDIENIMRLVICIVMVVLYGIEIITRIKSFNYYVLNFPLKYTVFAGNVSFLGGIVEIGLYFLYKDENMPAVYYILKIIIIIVNALLASFYFFSSLDIFFVNELIAKIFLEKSKMTPGDLAMYDMLLYNYLNDKCDFGELYHIYHTHKVKCTIQKCPCKILEIDKWIGKEVILEQNQHYLSVKLNKKKEEFKFSSIKDFIEIAEYEIRKNIILFKKDKGDMHFQQDLLILLHLDIIYLLKKDNCIAMYFCDRYRSLSKKINFITKYYLYEYKILISKELTSIDKLSSIDRTLNEKREMTRQMKEFYHYAAFMEKVKKMIINCVFALETILKYKRNQIMKGINIQSVFSCDQFLKISNTIQETNRLLTSNLKEYFKKKEPDNPELCILVCYYYLMLNQKPPKKMIRKLDEIFNKSKLKKREKLFGTTETENGDDYISNLAYDNLNISNPMIVILNSEDNFIIIHITMKMCSILKEGKREILKNDLHNYLPKEIVKMHKIIMKQFLLNSSVQFIKETFIIDKFHQLIPIKIVCNPLNTLETNFGFVINFVELPAKPNLYYDYYFLLDSEFNFLGLNELFTKEYFFSLQMMKIIHLDFCSFFGIKAEKLNLKLRNFFMQNKLTQKNEALEECNKEMSVFTCNKMENLFSKAKFANLGRKHQPLKVKEKLKKVDVINNISQLQKNFSNYGLDVEWYSRLNRFQSRLLMGIENSINNNNDLLKERSFLNFFETYYTINSIGNFYYIIVNLREILNNSKENQSEWNKELGSPHIASKSSSNVFDMRSRSKKKSKQSKWKATIGVADEASSINQSDLLSNTSKGQLLGSEGKSAIRHQLYGKKNKTYYGGEIKEEKQQIKNEEKPKRKSKKTGTSSIKKNQENKNNEKNHNEESLVVESRTLFNNQKLYGVMNYIWKFLILCQIFFCFLWVIFNQNDFKTAFELFYINLFATNIETDIFYSSLSMFARCGIYGELSQENLTKEIELMEQISEDLREHSKKFIGYINNQIQKNELSRIFEVLNKEEQIVNLLPNKKEQTAISSFYEEFSLYQFKIYQIANYATFEECTLDDIAASDTANDEMREIFYIVNNVIGILSDKFAELNQINTEIFINHINNSKRSSIYFIVTAIVAEIILMVFMQYIMSDHKANIQILLNQIYAPNKNDTLFEEDLYNYKELLFSFTKESYIHFRSMHRKILTNEKNDDFQINTIQSNESISEALSSKRDNNDNLNIGNMNIVNETGGTTEIIFKFSDKATIPKHHFITMIIMYISGFVFILIEIIHLIIVTGYYRNFNKSNTVALNFISLIPTLLELVLYTRISIMVNDENYITIPIEQYQKKDVFYNYYGVNLKETTPIIEKFGESKFVFLYYELNQIRNNIKAFIAEHKTNILPNVQKHYHHYILSGGNFCIYSSLGHYYYLSSEEGEIIDFTEDITTNEVATLVVKNFEEVNKMGKECRIYGGGFNMNSLETIIDATLLKLIGVFEEFTRRESSSREISEFMQDSDLLLLENNLKRQLKYIYTSYVYYTMKDINNLVKKTKNIGIIFAVCLLFSISFYTCIVMVLLKISNKNIAVLIYIKTFMSQALNAKG